MITIGIETATSTCGVAVVVDGAVKSEMQVQGKNLHAENIMRLVHEAVRVARVDPANLDVIAVSIGPGSFTGLRIGLSVAKGLCFALERPLVAVPTLTALALRAVESGDIRTPYVLAALDARRDEIYCSLFRIDRGTLDVVWEARDMTMAELHELLADKKVTLTGDSIHKILAEANLSAASRVDGTLEACSAASIAVLGERMAARQQFVDAATIEPAYIKAFFTRTSA